MCIITIIYMHLYAYPGNDNIQEWLEVIQDTCVYDHNNHAAFTSLEEWKGNMYLAFREAGYHRATPTDKGKIRVLKGNEHEWELHNTFFKDGIDLRDPYILKWKDRLLLYTTGYYSELTDDGWTELKPIKHNAPFVPSIWKIRVHNNVAYGIGNRVGYWPLLFKSEDGETWEVINEFKLGGDATEADIVFDGDIMYICIRIDTPIGSNSMWGQSVFPFTECRWSMMDVSVASPEMIKCSTNTFLLAGREYDYHRKKGKDEINVSLFVVDRDGHVMDRYIVQRQDGDQGYTSFCNIKGNKYYMSYYVGPQNTAVRLLTFKVHEKKLKKNGNRRSKKNIR